MRKYIALLVILTILQCQLSAQDRFFYGLQGEKIYLEEDPSSTIICFKSAKYTNIYIDSIIKNIDINAQYEFLSSKMVKFQNGILYDSIIKDLSKYRNDVSVSKVYYQNTDNIYWCNNKVVVILPSLNILHTLLSQLSIEYEDISSFNNDGVYVISLIGMEDRSIQVSNMLYETGMVLSAQPDFYFTAKLSNVHYGDQWGLYNVGQYSSVYSGIDINTTEAWDIASGNNVKVAVIDCGIDLTHPDLQNNLLLGYDATNGANGAINGACQYDNLNGHGTACAGIIAAENNNIGTIGVAYNSKIIPIRAGYVANLYNQGEVFVSSSTQMADAINKAWNDYEADVLSFSVVFNNINVVSLEINNALSNGRNGNGCIIAASAGNYFANDPTSINYPASDSRVIAVGAISPCGELKSFQSCDGETHWGSCYGSELSVVAPGVLIPTTDLQGNDGYNPTKPLHFNLGGSGSLNGNVISEYDDKDYTVWFAGTSAAAPHVSGIAALMLSVNQNLTSTQVQNIIEKTAQKIRTDLYTYANDLSIHPNGTWSDSLGYGLVDAHAAVMEAYFYDREIIGSDTINPCNLFIYTVNSSIKPNNTTVQWSVTGNVELVSVNGPYASIRPTGPGTGTLMVSYTHEGYTVTKEKIIIIDSPADDYYYNYSTTGNMTFNNELYINGAFTINSGNVVTINCVGQCFPDSKIVIMPGGKLVIDSGKLKNFCPNKMWDGIYVVGDSTQRQIATKQGTLEVKNGSVIENAKNAIVTWDGSDYATSGGIVKCSNSLFLNNGQSIRMYNYTNHTSGGTETDNVSYAQNCTFLVNNNNLFSSNNVTFSEFVKISHVRGISFKGSSFRDGRATVSTTTKGIWSIGAGFNASEHCSTAYNSNAPCTCPAVETRSKFSRLGYGIYATNDGTTYNFTADHAIFDTCYNAVYMSAINNSKVTRSDFDISTMSTFASGSATGIYSYNCSGYTIEANNFATNYSTRPSGYWGRGVSVFGSGTDANTIYRNTMTNLSYGIKSDGSNGGLQLQCNEFSGTFGADINVSGALSGSQGSSSKSAGNKFTSGVKKINSPSTYITYYHSGANSSLNEYCPNNSSATIVRVPNITANDCASTICIPFPAYPPTPKSAPENDDITLYESLQQMYNARLAEYNAAGYEFLLQNFDGNDADIVAIARLKQDTLITLSRTMAEIANRNLNAILVDSVLDRESLNGWYNRINTTTAKYSLANSYFETGEYALARQELAAIPQHFALSADELAEYDNFCDYNALRESVFTSGRNYAQLTDDEIAELEAIADLNTGVSSAYANSVLCFFYGICQEIEEQDFDDTPMNNKNAVANVEENETESLAVYVYPNPADDELNILISSLPEGITTIEFHDVAGRLMLSHEITSTNASINISSLKQGIYMYRIVNGDNVIARDRIVKNK